MSNALRFLRSQSAKRIISALALLLWMLFIFALSAQDSDTSGRTSGVIEDAVIKITTEDIESKTPYERRIVRETVFDIVRTSAHFVCFAVLGSLSLTALLTYRIKFYSKVIISFFFSLLYAVSDEVHQHFVPGRTFEWSDIGFDFLGVVCGVAAVLLILYIAKLKRGKKAENPQ